MSLFSRYCGDGRRTPCPCAANRGSAAHTRRSWRVRKDTRELAFDQLLISYLDNRYLAKAYQQFLDGYIYVIFYLKKWPGSALILSELANAIGNGKAKNCPDNAALFPYACGICVNI